MVLAQRLKDLREEKRLSTTGKSRLLRHPRSHGGWGNSSRDARTLGRFRRLMRWTNEADRLLLFMA